MSDNIKELKDLEKEMAADAEKDEKPDVHRGPGMGWVPGLILIGLGAFFLFSNFTGFRLENWWALFILIPAFGSLGSFLRAYQRDDRLSHEARGSLVGAMLFFTLSAPSSSA